MTDYKILEKALRKITPPEEYDEEIMYETIVGYVEFPEQNKYYELIFDHGFAKAFWGDGYLCDHKTGKACQPKIEKWKYYLQQMVLEEEPLKYLKKFL